MISSRLKHIERQLQQLKKKNPKIGIIEKVDYAKMSKKDKLRFDSEHDHLIILADFGGDTEEPYDNFIEEY